MDRYPAVYLLGPPTIRRSAEHEQPIPASSARLLVYLAMERRRHSREALAALFWPDHTSEHARSALRTAIYRLHALLGDDGLVINRSQVELSGESALTFDVEEIERAVSHVRSHHGAGEPLCRACRTRLQDALSGPVGPLIEGCAGGNSADFDDWLSAAGSRVEGWQTWARNRLSPQSPPGASVLGEAVPGYTIPYVSPCPQPVPADPSAATPRTGNLPNEPDLFVGRETEIATATSLLRSHRLVTLWGPGGVGKSRLALRIARSIGGDYPGGGWLIDLSSRPGRQSVTATIAETLGVRAERGVPRLDVVAFVLALRPTLLVLDNCEPLVDECAQAVRVIVDRCESVRIIATSREPLRLRGETLVPVEPFAVYPHADAVPSVDDLFDSPAVELFVERARHTDYAFVLNETNAEHVVDLLRCVDGLPLAIEFLARKVSLLSVREIVEEIELLSDTEGVGRLDPERHRSLEGLVSWSYRLLSEGARRLLLHLSVFSGPVDAGAIRSVCASSPVAAENGPWPIDQLRELVDKSLVMVVRAASTAESGAAPMRRRYRLLGIVRQFARSRLEESGESGSVRMAHLRWIRDITRAAYFKFDLACYRDVWADIPPLNNEIESALEWALSSGLRQEGLEICNALADYWGINLESRRAAEWYESFLSLTEPVRVETLARAHVAVSPIVLDDGTVERARFHLDRGLELYARLPLSAWKVVAEFRAARMVSLRDAEASYELAVDALRDALRLGVPWVIAQAREQLRHCAERRPKADRVARYQLDRMRDAAEDARLGKRSALTLCWCAHGYLSLGDVELANSCAEAALPQTVHEHSRVRAYVDLAFARLSAARGDSAGALVRLRTYLDRAVSVGSGFMVQFAVPCIVETLDSDGLSELADEARELSGPASRYWQTETDAGGTSTSRSLLQRRPHERSGPSAWMPLIGVVDRAIAAASDPASRTRDR